MFTRESHTNRAQRRFRASKRNLVRQVVPEKVVFDRIWVTIPAKVIWHRKHFNQVQFGDFSSMWKEMNQMPKQNSKRSKKRGLNAVLSIG